MLLLVISVCRPEIFLKCHPRFRRVEFIKTMNRPEDVRLTKKES